ncbi:MAG: enoyl-CoA hydratase/isomerase family protein [Planctomycetes bacterium]|nr:enoyl-CoA hydratase/isomerase family protein [Planctomycetota bacterium]
MNNDPSGPVTVTELDDGAFWRVALARPKANVLDAAMTRALRDVFARATDARRLAGVLLTSDGPHFSFGASVQEHLPAQVAGMLSAFHGLFRDVAAARLPVVAAVRGQCLGGGLELASFCHRLVVAPDAKLGQPEIKLGVIAPVASALLPERVGPGVAADLCLSGRTIDANEALACGLADRLSDDPEAAALSWLRESLLAHSAMSLRFATHALRAGFNARFFPTLDRLERLYLDDLMRSGDAVEGIRAFLDKRTPRWSHA